MKFVFPTVSGIANNIRNTIIRFPLAMLAGVSGTVLGIVLIHREDPSFYTNLLLTVTLSFPLFIGIVSLGERQLWERKTKIIANAFAILFLTGYYFWLPDRILEAEEMFVFRYILWAVGFALFITFAPFFKREETENKNTFWQYNRRLFFSIALTVLWTLAIHVGLSIAMFSIDFLFDIDIAGERYLELWVSLVGIFSTLFFLSRLPQNIDSLENTEDYPKELRLFSQYVLVPLVGIYFLILYAYVLRIIIVGQWPEGVLAYMILGFSLLGVFAYVCLYPLSQKVSWIRKAGLAFYLALIPQVGMLFWALWFRLREYGFTEKRYFVFIFGWWLLFIAIYFLLSRKKDVKVIPITIFFIVFISSFGPWGAFSVSRISQSNRLEKILVRNDLLADGKVKKAEKEISFADKKEISATLRYLIRTHGTKSVQPYFAEDLKTLEKKKFDDGSKK